jgi:lactoylglutathione lyase
MNTFSTLTFACGFTLATLLGPTSLQSSEAKAVEPMDLGAFSVSLAVKDIHASKAFYEKLDFKKVAGDIKQNWLVLQNGTTTIGLFQGMFKENIMTFNPGWTPDQETIKGFLDVRELQKKFKERGLKLTTEADESTSGPASLTLADPDGNMILLDQHVASPK